MKFRHTQQKHQDNDNDELPFNYRKARPASVSTPTVDRYYRKIQAQKTNAPNQSLSALDKIAIATIIILMGIWSIVILSFTLALRDATTFLGVFLVLTAYWIITWVSYYVGWKFYWIMLAVGWILATGYALTVFGLLQQAFYQLVR
jgi:CHASE2 domain-containing sensor protein